MFRRIALAWVLALLVAGCGRSVDPLEWRIEADDAMELQVWLDENVDLMPADLAAELLIAVHNLKTDTLDSSGGNTDQRGHRLAKRLDGRTVREVVIAGHEIAHDMLAARIQNQMRTVEQLLQGQDDLSEAETEVRNRRVEQHRLSVIALKQKLAAGEKRLAELLEPKAER